MLKLEHTEVVGWEAAIRGMRNPMNSWEKSDSDYRKVLSKKCDECGKFALPNEDSCDGCWINDYKFPYNGFAIGPNDLDLMTRLRNAGTDHRKFMRMIVVYVDLTAPLYWWKEFDTYKVGTVANSCSTMHKIAAKEFTLEDFSFEHLLNGHPSGFEYPIMKFQNNEYVEDEEFLTPLGCLGKTIEVLNVMRHRYLKTKNKDYWWQMIQLLPSSYNQKRTVMLNYEVLANIYRSRRNHKLDEWHTFCDWIEGLPYSKLITGLNLKDIPISNEIMEEAKRRVREELDKKEWRKANPKLDELERKSYVRTVEGNKIKYEKE